jgi:hypothetical protein
MARGSTSGLLKGPILALGLLIAFVASQLPSGWSAGLDILSVHVRLTKQANSVRFRTDVSANGQSDADGPRRAIMMLVLEAAR